MTVVTPVGEEYVAVRGPRGREGVHRDGQLVAAPEAELELVQAAFPKFSP